jgi:hypothetical protein
MSDQVSIETINEELAQMMGRFSVDPLGFVLYAFPWGEKNGELEFEQPEDWQIKFLTDVGKKLKLIAKSQITRQEKDKVISNIIRKAIASGHGIGKSALVAWLIMWAMSTRIDTRGVITANTENQLKTKTWAELSKWHRMCVTSHWFKYEATSISSILKGHEKSWRIDAVTWSLKNTEAFAGLHNEGKRILIIMDEASAIPDEIFEVAEGAQTDATAEVLFLCFGNPTRNVGRFKDCFGRFRHRWDTDQIDSRTVRRTNKEQIKEWEEDWGEDSDYFRVRVRGVFPRQSDRQFISSELIYNATKVKLRDDQYNFEPVILGVDAAIYGDDEFTIYLRQGLFSKKLSAVRKIDDDFLAASMVRNFEKEYKADAVFVDMGSGTGIVSAGRQMGRNWTLVPFGGASSDRTCLNKRAEMVTKTKAWLEVGGRIEPDPIIEEQLGAMEYKIILTKQGDKLKLESKEDMKKRNLASPDRADGLFLTFAYPVTKHMAGKSHNRYDAKRVAYDPLKTIEENEEDYNVLG